MPEIKPSHEEQIAAERSLLAKIKKANHNDLSEQFDFGLDEKTHKLAELAVANLQTKDEYTEGAQKVGLLAKVVDPSNPNAVSYHTIPVAEVIKSDEFPDVILPLGNTSLEQAQSVVQKADGLRAARETGVLPNLASNLHQVDDIRNGKHHLPPVGL